MVDGLVTGELDWLFVGSAVHRGRSSQRVSDEGLLEVVRLEVHFLLLLLTHL